MNFSDYIVYADESGDHSLVSINPQNPVFVLAFVICAKADFVGTIVPSIQRLKFEFWGHDGVVLHGHEVRKSHGDFNILLNGAVRERFFERLNGVIEAAPFTVIAAVIDKAKHVRRYRDPANPYEIALAFCLERLRYWLNENGQGQRTTHVLFERRGASEDNKLELEFRRLTQGEETFAIRFMDKKHNSSGLQLADLVAHPIGRHVINPGQPNRAFELIERKFRRSPRGIVAGYGLKIFP
ncbi:MAG TPA: DUF3800 domain-containing protein [Rhabdaerophilum sp.]|nr:DUF3800 domain-containing protein [Rhabdaerophilum sp.]